MSGSALHLGTFEACALPDSLELRRLALAVSVLDDVDIVPLDDGVLLTGDTPVEVELAASCAARWPAPTRPTTSAGPGSAPGCAAAGSPPTCTPSTCASSPARSACPSTTRCTRASTGCGTGSSATPSTSASASSASAPTRTRSSSCPQGALDAAGVDPAPWWPVVRDYLERMGAVAAERLGDQPGAAADR